jgi:histidyl-tRNA synthetase
VALNKKAYKGCRDFLPADMRVRDYLFNQMKKTAELFAYEAYDGPLLEEVELYKAKSGEELINDQIYSFTDRGNRHVAIRPEMTPTVARMVAGVHKQAAKPLRWYSIPNLMRYEKPQRGRVREHWQFNVDIFGAAPNLGEIEVLNLIIDFLSSFGATSEMFSILLNDRKVVDAVFNDLLKLNKEDAYKLYKVIDKAKKVTPEKLDTMISEIISDETSFNIFKSYLALDSFESLKKFLTTNSLESTCEEFLQLAQMVTALDLESFVQYDPTIVRGLDYYTGMVFEIFDIHPDNNRAIAGGGAYANLLQIFNEKPLQGIGFGLGDVTLRDFLETHKLLPDLSKANHDLLIVYTDAANEVASFKFANELRSIDLKAELNLGPLKFNKVFKLAETKGQNFVAIVEEKDGELQVQLKNLATRDGQFFNLKQTQEIYNFIKDN